MNTIQMAKLPDELHKQSERVAHFVALLQGRDITADDLYTLHQLHGAGQTIEIYCAAAIDAIHAYLGEQVIKDSTEV
jgi:hypothetical protein